MAHSLWDVLGAIADRRGRKGRQLPLPAILAIAIAAMLAGANDLRAIFRWGRRLTPEALALFGIERAPCHATYHYVFQSLDGDALARALGEFARGSGEPWPYRHRWQDVERQPPARRQGAARALGLRHAVGLRHWRSRRAARPERDHRRARVAQGPAAGGCASSPATRSSASARSAGRSRMAKATICSS